jgi:serine protease Do
LTAHRLSLPSTAGALVKDVIRNSPAERAQLKIGDVIVEFDGIRVENDGHLVKTVGLTPVGRTVPVIFYRDGKRMQVDATLEANPDQ